MEQKETQAKSKNSNTTKKMVMIIAIIAVVGISVSFGYFVVHKVSDSGNAISGRVQKKGPKVELTENKEGIVLTGTYPMTDEMGESLEDAYIFTIKNEENKAIDAKIIMEVTKNSNLDDSLINISINGTVVTLSTLTKTPVSGNAYRDAYIIKTDKLSAGASSENTIKMWLNENGTKENAEGKTWESSILIAPEFTE